MNLLCDQTDDDLNSMGDVLNKTDSKIATFY